MNWKYLILFAFLLFISCKTTKTLAKTELSINSSSDLMAKVQMAQPTFTTANMSKVSISLKFDKKEMNVSASCKIRRDSVIYLSIHPFIGIELFKAELLPDSIRVFDKMNGRYFVNAYDLFSDNFGVKLDFKSFQALLTNQLFSVDKNGYSTAHGTTLSASLGQQQIEFKNDAIIQTTAVSDSYNILKVLMNDLSNKHQVTIDYSGFSTTSGVNFPKEINILAKNEKNTASCNFLIERVEFDSPIRFVPTNPHRFVRTDIYTLLHK
jgi:hypothetical protein